MYKFLKILSLIPMSAMALNASNTIIIPDGDFESTPSLWRCSDKNMSKITAQAAHSGKLGLQVTDNDSIKGSSAFSAPIKVKADTYINLSFYAKNTNAGIGVYLRFVNSQNKIVAKSLLFCKFTGSLLK